MAEKKTTKEELMEKLEPVGEAVAKASRTLTDAAKEAASIAAPTVRAAAKTVRPAAEAAGKAIRETGRKAAKTAAEASSALIPEVYVQWDGRQFSCADVADRVRADFRANNRAAIRSCRIYIKPEDGAAYYVINGKEGKIPL